MLIVHVLNGTYMQLVSRNFTMMVHIGYGECVPKLQTEIEVYTHHGIIMKCNWHILHILIMSSNFSVQLNITCTPDSAWYII